MSGTSTLEGEPTATKVEFRNDSIFVHLSDARTMSVPVAWYDGLWEADDEDLVLCEVAGAGTTIYWPTLRQVLPVRWIVQGKQYVRPKRGDPMEGLSL